MERLHCYWQPVVGYAPSVERRPLLALTFTCHPLMRLINCLRSKDCVVTYK